MPITMVKTGENVIIRKITGRDGVPDRRDLERSRCIRACGSGRIDNTCSNTLSAVQT